MMYKKDDILISREPHSCKVKFVEDSNEGGILLVDGVKDEFFEPFEYHVLREKYRLLCLKEDRKDL